MLRKVFEPIKINQLELQNRMIVSAMVTQYCGEDGLPTEKWTKYFERKARGGWGLMFTENYGVSKEANSFKRQAGLWDDSQIPPHTEFVKRIHAAGGVIGCQIYHSGRQNKTSITGTRPIGPSAIKEPSMPETPRAMTIEEIEKTIEQFGETALRAKKCGFDAVEVHGGHGYLVNQFVSGFANKRTDKYGGTLENRARFAVEIIKTVRAKVGPDFPISYRLSTCDYTEGGVTLTEAQVLAKMIVDAGADMIHCTQGMYISKHTLIPPTAVPQGAFADNAAAIKAVVDVPVVATGRINDPILAETILQSGKADLITMGRASLADADMPNKAKDGRMEDILRCIGCCQGCTGENAKGNQIRCLVNPLTGKEDEYDLTPAKESRKVYIAGGGVTGCEAAVVAAQKGHQVTIFEKAGELGGQWIQASIPPAKAEFTSLLYWQQTQIEKLGIKVCLNTELTKEIIAAESPDTVIIATGSTPLMPPIPGLKESKMVTTAIDVLSGKTEAGAKVVVAGGGLVGSETAEHLAMHGVKDVSIVEMMPEIMRDGEASPKKLLIENLDKYGVKIYTETKLEEVKENAIVVSDHSGKYSIDNIDTLIMSLGVRNYNVLEEQIETLGCKVIVAGDALRGKNGYKNIQEGYEAGLNA